MEESFNGMWLSEAYNPKDNKDLTITQRIWHRSWLESIAIKNLPYFAKRKSNYFFKKGLAYEGSEVLELSQESLPSVYIFLQKWATAKGLEFDLKKLQKTARHLFDYHSRVFLIEKCRKEIEVAIFFTGKK